MKHLERIRDINLNVGDVRDVVYSVLFGVPNGIFSDSIKLIHSDHVKPGTIKEPWFMFSSD